MDDCIFCKIAKGDIPCHKVYEDDLFLAFHDIMPFSPGHCLLIPKKHFRWVYEVDEVGKYWATANKIAKSILKIIKPGYISFWTFGNEVTHAHIHIVPRFVGDRYTGIIKPLKKPITPDDIQIATQIFSDLQS